MKETAPQRAVSRLRRTNDRSVLRVISSDAEHATLMSYASKRKYKLDLSSLHEDHEDDENAENGVVEWSQKKTRREPRFFGVCGCVENH